jgi:hypothetical protein
LRASDPENDKLEIEWSFTAEAASYITGGDFQQSPESYADSILSSTSNEATIKAPAVPGLYRVYVYIRDPHGGGASANVPIRVGDKSAPKSDALRMPLMVFDEPDERAVYATSGWMGKTEAIRMNLEHRDNPKSGEHCIEFSFLATEGWGGVVWQHPAEDWGDLPGGFDLTGAKQLSFWARGKQGGEEVKFGFGLLGAEKRFPDSGGDEVTVRLEQEWREYRIDLDNKDLSCIKTGFYWVAAAQAQPLIFYLDRISYQ